MMYKLPLELDAAKLKEIAPERLQGQSVAAVLLALGSNYQAKYYFPRVHKSLAALGEIQISTAFQNPDFTATLEHPKPDYTNQCVYLSLTDSMTLQQLQKIFKSFEGDCNRQRPIEPATIRQVTMDIDILLIKLDSKNNNCSDEWMIMADRYPFKAHESAGIVELVESSL
ncbi:2-amino-4-hydroxy-6-hydroxymethyldihydropteridine diphosphokinase [Psychrobacter frigidicola]|uniref:2-amino-4-hydroxy-6- hydroxymethyldihydropteridine diphosphokinase n=1 Tax=Psychrobacter frigidicola TaxID=45611 RepID=UPI001D0FA537|nr:2-amino-4-hydroxy-6-hydroxymethyldihydropteridine diphosphokinase [Psychrobacter frigidicola]